MTQTSTKNYRHTLRTMGYSSSIAMRLHLNTVQLSVGAFLVGNHGFISANLIHRFGCLAFETGNLFLILSTVALVKKTCEREG